MTDQERAKRVLAVPGVMVLATYEGRALAAIAAEFGALRADDERVCTEAATLVVDAAAHLERTAVVEWLRATATERRTEAWGLITGLADSIEAGEHAQAG